MRVLVIGSGAREHALVWKLSQSSRVSKLYAAPGNPGTAALAENVALGVAQLQELADFAENAKIDLTVIGPEVPLIEGLADLFRKRGLRAFGPGAAGAALEGSKVFAKDLLTKAGIPTAAHRTFTNAAKALSYLEEHGAPVVVKADGNAAGKGAIVALDLPTAQDAVRQMMIDHVFGEAGDRVVIEDYLEGDEIGSTAICDGRSFLPLTLTQDHKRALDNDQGLNTGGMGVYSPLSFVDTLQEKQIHTQVIQATLDAMADQGIHFSGVLYSNIMLTAHGPMVIEHNTRFGDPETQALMLLLQSDLLDLLEFSETQAEVARETLWRPGFAMSLTLASGGYPGDYRKGLPISGLKEANALPGIQVFHAGTALKDGEVVTAGGRVLSIAAQAATLEETAQLAYEAAKLLSFKGMQYRKDIAHRALHGI